MSAHWHHPTSARQARSAYIAVRSESHCSVTVMKSKYPRKIDLTYQCVLIRLWSLLRDLATNELSGTIPPLLGNLTQLSTLYAHHRGVVLENIYNSAGRSHPIDFTEACGLISCLRSLQYNALTGPIPPELGNLIQLQGGCAIAILVVAEYMMIDIQLISLLIIVCSH